MKHRLSLLISSILLCLTGSGATATTTASLSTFLTEPFSLYNDMTTMEISAVASTKDVFYYEIYIINDLYPDGELLFSGSFSSKKSKTYTYDNELTRTSNKISIKWHTSKIKKINVISHTVEMCKPKTIRIKESPYKYESTSNSLLYSSAVGWKLVPQTLTFSNFDDHYVPDYYHKIDLSNFKITCNAGYPGELNYGNAFLYVSNANGKFNYLEQTGSKAVVTLSIKTSSRGYEMSFLKPLYVDQLTLQMSSTPRTGFVKTNYFYLPRDEKRFEEEYEFDLRINGLGIEKSTFVTTFRYKSVLNILGDCRNSKYCVVNR